MIKLLSYLSPCTKRKVKSHFHCLGLLLFTFITSSRCSASGLFEFTPEIIGSVSCSQIKLHSLKSLEAQFEKSLDCDVNDTAKVFTSYINRVLYLMSPTSRTVANFAENEPTEFTFEVISSQPSVSYENVVGVSANANFVYNFYHEQNVLAEAQSYFLGHEEKLNIAGVLQYEVVGHFFDEPYSYIVIALQVQSSGITKWQTSLIRLHFKFIFHDYTKTSLQKRRLRSLHLVLPFQLNISRIFIFFLSKNEVWKLMMSVTVFGDGFGRHVEWKKVQWVIFCINDSDFRNIEVETGTCETYSHSCSLSKKVGAKCQFSILNNKIVPLERFYLETLQLIQKIISIHELTRVDVS